MIGKKIVTEAVQYLDVKYVKNGITPQGFDCSGFVCYVYKKVTGIDLPHQTTLLITKGNKVTQEQLKPGDIVFPTQSYCGIYIGSNQIIYVSSEKVKYGDLKYLKFYTARRIVNN